MEVDAWSNRAHLGVFQPHQNHMQSGEEEDILDYFPCPFCYIEVEVPFLWSHLEEEHCFDFRNAVCPMCADNPGTDMISHFTIQHTQLLKRRRKSHRSSLWNQNPSTVYEVDSFREMEPNQGTFGAGSAPDPLLSQFICNVAPIKTDMRKVNHTRDVTPVSSHEQRLVAPAVETLGKEDLEERLQRIEFVREMLVSTIF